MVLIEGMKWSKTGEIFITLIKTTGFCLVESIIKQIYLKYISTDTMYVYTKLLIDTGNVVIGKHWCLL